VSKTSEGRNPRISSCFNIVCFFTLLFCHYLSSCLNTVRFFALPFCDCPSSPPVSTLSASLPYSFVTTLRLLSQQSASLSFCFLTVLSSPPPASALAPILRPFAFLTFSHFRPSSPHSHNSITNRSSRGTCNDHTTQRSSSGSVSLPRL
jgi:hypothetical protein